MTLMAFNVYYLELNCAVFIAYSTGKVHSLLEDLSITFSLCYLTSKFLRKKDNSNDACHQFIILERY